MWKDAVWLGVPASEIKQKKIYEGDMTGRFAYYRCELEIPVKAGLVMDITANSRYRLWINARPVLSGPCKGDEYRCYYETVDVSSYLVTGKNVFAVQVLYNNPDTAVDQTKERAAIFGVRTPGGGHRLAVEGTVRDSAGRMIGTVTTGKADWRVFLEDSFYLKSNEITVNLGAVCEEIDFRKAQHRWKGTDFEADGWAVPRSMETVGPDPFFEAVGILPRFRLKEREIPLLYETEDCFTREVCVGDQEGPCGILGKKEVEIPAGESRDIILDAGVIKNAYPSFRFQGGKGSRVSFTYFEKFVNEERKIRRDDAEHGSVIGLTDTILLDEGEVDYEPFWYRTFRFLRIRVEAGKEAVWMKEPVYRKTGYPLKVESWVKSSAPWVEKVWELCVRTLENCMTETYMDCPYYEQMQFPMDTRLQAMFNYVVSTDVRLAKKALEDFHYSLLPQGLIPGKYPSAYCQVISTFSLHYIYMLQEYYQQTADLGTVKRYLPDVDAILGYYDRKIGEDSLVGRLGYWEFVDWQEAWKENFGIPAALQEGSSTVINLMYAFALQCAAWLNEAAGRSGMAQEYRERRQRIRRAVEEHCWDGEKGMYREGRKFAQYSQHAQAWAVWDGLEDREKGRRALINSMDGSSVIPCSFSTAYEYFRAMEKAGLYKETEANIMRWALLPEQGCTTCPEEPENARSDCHAWSALPIYEMIRCMAGICPGQPGWEQVRICPHMEYLPDLEGEAATPKGTVGFRYRYISGKWEYRVILPEGLSGTFVYPDGREAVLAGGENIL